MARSHDRRQTRLDFDARRRERRQLVEAIAHHRSGLSRRVWANIQTLLVYFIHCEGDEGIFPYIASIERDCGLSRRTVNRTIQAAKRLGILTATRRANKSGRASNGWRIHYDRLARLGMGQNGPNQGQNGPNQGQNGPNQGQNGPNPIKRNYSLTQELNSPPPLPPTSPATADRDDWQVAVEEIFALGINQAARAVQSAISRGATVAALRELAAYWQAHREGWPYPEVALYRRIARYDRDLVATAGWEPFAAQYAAAQARAQRDARLAAESRARHVARGGPKLTDLAASGFSFVAAWRDATSHPGGSDAD